MNLPAPRCIHCDIDMVPKKKKHHAWKCPICKSKYRVVSHLQSYMEHIALLDQLIAREKKPETKAILEKRLEEVEKGHARCEELQKLGMIYEDHHEWTAGEKR